MQGDMAPTRSSTRGPMPRRRNIHCIEFLHRRPRTTASALTLHSLMPFNETPKHAEKVSVQQQEPATALPTTVPTAIFPDQPRCRQRPTNIAATIPESVGFLPTATSPRLMLLVRLLLVQLKTSASVFAVDNPPMISSCDGSDRPLVCLQCWTLDVMRRFFFRSASAPAAAHAKPLPHRRGNHSQRGAATA